MTVKESFLVIGAGFSGAVLARELVEALDCFVEVRDERDHIAGNCHTERDPETNVMVHKYGPHIFNTDDEKVWSYVRRFGDFRPFVNRVKAVTSRGVFSLPINLMTINQFFGKSLNPAEAELFVQSLGDRSIGEPANFEEQALKMLGRDLYEAFFKGYTIKQWGCHPRELPASVLKRLPVRFNYDDNYYNKPYQGIPAEGYTSVIQGILDHPRISVRLGCRFDGLREAVALRGFDHLFYTGPIDAFFAFSEGRLGYRTVTFERIKTDAVDYQGNAVINYTEETVPWTRIHEHKHFAPWEKHERTTAFREHSQETGPQDPPYYPKRLAADKASLQRYRFLAECLANGNGAATKLACPVSFLGRLATYRYLDMGPVIGEALGFSERFITSRKSGGAAPVFSNNEP
jgi:UDP-galactopyranose mutase